MAMNDENAKDAKNSASTIISQVVSSAGKREEKAADTAKEGSKSLLEKAKDVVEDKVIDPIIEEARRLMCEPIRCEENGDKGFLVRELLRRDVYAMGYTEHMNKFVKIATILKKWWPRIIFLEGTDPEYIDQILDYTENAEHDDAPDSAACVCRSLESGYR